MAGRALSLAEEDLLAAQLIGCRLRRIELAEQVERFFKPRMEGGMMITKQGPIKTFPLRGIKESPPYLHDGRLFTLEDSVEFFNLVLELKLAQQEKSDLVAFLRAL